jgi:hypothetical protein
MILLERISNYQSVWTVALPHLPPPSAESAARWGAFPLEVVEAAILRAGRRFAKSRITEDFDPTSACRYVTGTARAMMQREGVCSTDPPP